jgi:hypothetical protein
MRDQPFCFELTQGLANWHAGSPAFRCQSIAGQSLGRCKVPVNDSVPQRLIDGVAGRAAVAPFLEKRALPMPAPPTSANAVARTSGKEERGKLAYLSREQPAFRVSTAIANRFAAASACPVRWRKSSGDGSQ